MNKKNTSIILAFVGLLFIVVGIFGSSITGFVTLKFTAIINNPPVLINLNNQSVIIGGNLTLDVNATDIDGHNLTFNTSSAYYPINNTTGVMNFTFNASHGGDNAVRITVTDQLGGQDYQDVVFSGIGEYCGDLTCQSGESCSSCSQDCGTCVEAPSSSSGGGGSGYVIDEPLEVDPEVIEVELEREKKTNEKITITNQHVVSVNVEIDLGEMRDFIEIDKDKFTINKNKKETVKLTITAPENKPAGLNKGFIEIKSGQTSKKVLVSVIINDKKGDFKINIKSDNKLDNLERGDLIKISAENKNELEDVMFNVIINNLDNELIHSFSKKFSSKEYIYEYIIPESMEGEFVMYSKVDIDGEGIIESDILKIEKGEEEERLSIVESDVPYGKVAFGGISLAAVLILSLLSLPAFRMFYVNSNLLKTRNFIGKGDLVNAKFHYNKVRNLYKKLSKGKRKELFKECDEVFKLVNKRHK